MTHARIQTAKDDATEASTSAAMADLVRGPARVCAEIVDAAQLAEARAQWPALVAIADTPNIFMDPALLGADVAMPLKVVLAWDIAGSHRRLVGLWAFAHASPPRSVLPLRVLTAPPSPHSYLATPVIDRDLLDPTLDAMLDVIAEDRAAGPIVALDMMATDDVTWVALRRVLAARGCACCVVDETVRPKLASALDGKTYLEAALSGGSRKKLRQYRRRLAEKGAVTFTIADEPAAVRAALEDFLAIEAAGWKGLEGTALLSDEDDAAFMRDAVAALAAERRVSILSLRLDGKPVSMQIVARCGGAAYTWKTTYDEAFQDFSPGMLLLEDYTAALLADKSIA
jgi:CelD/BcsL family acetyltransferase involved in cellulose biosynthesis